MGHYNSSISVYVLLVNVDINYKRIYWVFMYVGGGGVAFSPKGAASVSLQQLFLLTDSRVYQSGGLYPSTQK